MWLSGNNMSWIGFASSSPLVSGCGRVAGLVWVFFALVSCVSTDVLPKGLLVGAPDSFAASPVAFGTPSDVTVHRSSDELTSRSAGDSTLADVEVTTRPRYLTPDLSERKNQLSFAAGAALWDQLGDIDPANSGFDPRDFGDFEEWAPHFGISYYRNALESSGVSLWLGLEMGVQSFENEEEFDVLLLPSGETIDGRFYADTLYFTPAVSLQFHIHEMFRLFVGGGGGLYHLEFDESFSGFSADIESDTAFGGFVAAGAEVLFGETGMAVRVEDYVHFMEFENLDRVFPGDNEIDGPFNVVRVAFIYRF